MRHTGCTTCSWSNTPPRSAAKVPTSGRMPRKLPRRVPLTLATGDRRNDALFYRCSLLMLLPKRKSRAGSTPEYGRERKGVGGSWCLRPTGGPATTLFPVTRHWLRAGDRQVSCLDAPVGCVASCATPHRAPPGQVTSGLRAANALRSRSRRITKSTARNRLVLTETAHRNERKRLCASPTVGMGAHRSRRRTRVLGNWLARKKIDPNLTPHAAIYNR